MYARKEDPDSMNALMQEMVYSGITPYVESYRDLLNLRKKQLVTQHRSTEFSDEVQETLADIQRLERIITKMTQKQ
jgi:hypothetical protein